MAEEREKLQAEINRLRTANASLSRELKFFQEERQSREKMEESMLQTQESLFNSQIVELENRIRDTQH